jgi:hypothetical protein
MGLGAWSSLKCTTPRLLFFSEIGQISDRKVIFKSILGELRADVARS